MDLVLSMTVFLITTLQRTPPVPRFPAGAITLPMIRVYQHGDHSSIAEIFSRAVHEIASAIYTPEQCEAWASREINYDHWQRRCELKRPFIAEENGHIAGFLELDPDGHIDCAYIHPDFQRLGIMTALVRHAIKTCFAFGVFRVYVDASLCIRPLLEKLGFKVVEERTVVIRGIGLLNYRMELLSGK
jgi:ribosomal protein S18 acetylase RimI-like enzyme